MTTERDEYQPLHPGAETGDADVFPIQDGEGKWGPWDTRDALVARIMHGKSSREAEERLLGELGRRAPSRAMQQAYLQLLDWARQPYADPEGQARKNVLYVQGEPGIGKTELPFILSHALGYRHVFIPYGASGGDIDNLVIEKEFNGEGTSDLVDKIEKSLSSSRPSAVLVRGLQAKGWLSEDGKSLTWEPAEGKFDDELRALYDLASAAGVLKSTAGLVNVKTRNGRLLSSLIDAAEEGRQAHAEGRLPKPVLVTIDEFNRNKLFGSRLQNFWEVMSGKREQCDVEGRDAIGNPVTYTFAREDLAHLFIYMTGNDPEKVPSAREIPSDLKDRIGVESIPDFTAEDWQARFEYKLCGMPIDPHYQASKDHWDKEEVRESNGFFDLLQMRRTQGMSAARAKNVSPRENLLLAHWDQVNTACNQIGQFMVDWRDAMDSRTLAAALREGGQSRARYVGPRLVDDLIAETYSEPPKPTTRERNAAAHRSGDYNKKPIGPEEIGTRLVAAITRRIDADFPKNGSDAQQAARQFLYRAMVERGVIARDLFITEFPNEQPPTAAPGVTKTAVELLNVRENLRHQHLGEIQQVLCDILRERHPDQYGGVANDRLITRSQLDAALTALETQQSQAKPKGKGLPDFIQPIAMPALEPGTSGLTLIRHGGTLVDTIALPEQVSEALNQKLEQQMQPDAILSTTEFLGGLALGDTEQVAAVYPAMVSDVLKVRRLRDVLCVRASMNGQGAEDPKQIAEEKTLDAYLKKIGKGRGKDAPESGDTREHFMNDTHVSGLGCSAVRTRSLNAQGKWVEECLGILSIRTPGDEGKPERVLIVGQSGISPELRQLLKEKQIDYVGAQEENAQATVTGLVRGMVADAHANLDRMPDQTFRAVFEESNHSGLLFGLQASLNSRIGGGYDVAIENDEAYGTDLAQRRAACVAAQLLFDHASSNKTHPLFATRIESESLASGTGRRA